MKRKLLISTIFVIIFQYTYTQDYIPLAVEGVHWIVRFDDIETIYPVDGLWEYYATGDTVIDEVLYAKIYKRDLVVTQDGPPFEADGPYILYGFIRDDSIERKVYAIKFHEFDNCPVNEEYLLFDFSLNIGDTADLCIIPSYCDLIVQNIYPSEVLGFATNVYQLNGQVCEGLMYEGMGSNYGLFEEMFTPVKKEGDKNLYSISLYYYCRESPCDLLVSLPEETFLLALKVYPNPANNYIIFELPVIPGPSVVISRETTVGSDEKSPCNNPQSPPQISITNTFGQQIAQLEVKGNKTVWDARTIQAGVYFYFLEISGKRYSGKVIVQK